MATTKTTTQTTTTLKTVRAFRSIPSRTVAKISGKPLYAVCNAGQRTIDLSIGDQAVLTRSLRCAERLSQEVNAWLAAEIKGPGRKPTVCVKVLV